jgi:hypothetical protein
MSKSSTTTKAIATPNRVTAHSREVVASANSIRRRIASEREGLSFCLRGAPKRSQLRKRLALNDFVQADRGQPA